MPPPPPSFPLSPTVTDATRRYARDDAAWPLADTTSSTATRLWFEKRNTASRTEAIIAMMFACHEQLITYGDWS